MARDLWLTTVTGGAAATAPVDQVEVRGPEGGRARKLLEAAAAGAWEATQIRA